MDGIQQNFSYVHYLTAWLGKEEEERVIKIIFATHSITTHGFCLDNLYDELVKFSVKSVKANDERYLSMVDRDKIFVAKINIQ